MRVRSGHLILLAGVALAAMLGFVFLSVGGPPVSTQAAPELTATVPPQGTDPALAPALALDGDKIDVGTVSNKEPTRRPVRVRNTGRAPLHLREIKTSCVCTVGHLPEGGLTISPQSEGTFDVEIFPARIPGFEATRKLTIYSNDPRRPQFEFEVTSHVDPEYSLTPAELDFGVVSKGAEAKLTMRLRQLRDEPVEVKEINTFGPQKKGSDGTMHADDFIFTVIRRPEDQWAAPGKAEYDLGVALSPTIPAGTLDNKKLFVVTNVARVPSLPVMLKGNVTAPYTLKPAPPMKLNIRADASTGIFAPVYAEINAEAPVSIEDIAVSSPSIEAVAKPGDTPNQARVRVTVLESAPAGAIEEEVRFSAVINGQKYTERVGVRSFVVKK